MEIRELNMNESRFTTPTVMVPTLLLVAALTACGGGSSDAGTSNGISAPLATQQAANASQVSDSVTAALDASETTAQAVIAAYASLALSAPDMSALSSTDGVTAQPAALTSVPVTCPGGGGATVTITGGTQDSVLNGELDAGETYQLSFATCRAAASSAPINGSLTMTVQTASGSEISIALAANALQVTLPQGVATLTGSATGQITRSTLADGSTEQTSHFVSSSLALSTLFNGRSSEFNLSAVDVTRQSAWLLGTQVSSSFSGRYTLEATLPSGLFNYTVSTLGSVNYSSSGVPTAGAWTINLPGSLVSATVSGTLATITLDNGKDGTIDRTVTLPVQQLLNEAG